MDVGAFFDREFEEHAGVAAATRQSLREPFSAMLALWVRTIAGGGKILFFGNGGSAADAQHLATELTVRYAGNRPPIAAIALATDSSALTACGNDFGFEQVFARQVEALGRPGDLAVGISTSGRSANVLAGLRMARQRGLSTAALTGGDDHRLEGLADPVLVVPSATTARIQEMHIAIGQMLCAGLEIELGLA